MDVPVRPARPGDGGAIGRIFVASARAAWAHFLPTDGLAAVSSPPERWRHATGRQVVLVAERDGQVVAFAVIRPSHDEGVDRASVGELDAFYALPSVWGLGVGRALMAATLDALRGQGFRAATLWTAEQNQRPRRIYQAAGWRLDGGHRRKTYLGVEFVELRYRIAL
jgi:GNAT superfamily N-acetyltransferase